MRIRRKERGFLGGFYTEKKMEEEEFLCKLEEKKDFNKPDQKEPPHCVLAAPFQAVYPPITRKPVGIFFDAKML